MVEELLNEVVGKFTVLYVEDDITLAQKTKKLFDELFAKVDVAYNGVEALEKYDQFFLENEKNYDIIISDIRMPQMDGVELSKEIRKINEDQEIIIISAHNESDILQSLINIGIRHFIHKPIRFDELITVLTTLNETFSKKTKKTKKINDLEKMNKEFDALLKGYDSMIIASRTDLNGIITYASEAFVKISGYTKEELIGKSHSLVKHPDTPKEVFQQIWKTITAGKMWKGKLKNLAKNCEVYWAKTTIGPYFDENGEIIGYNSIREDITADMKVKELNKRVKLLLNNATDGYMLFDENLRVLQGYSNACLDIFEKDTIDDLSVSDLLFGFDSTNKRVFELGVSHIFNIEDNNQKDLLVSLLPTSTKLETKYINIRYKSVNKNNMMVIIQDATEKIKLKEELELKHKHQKMIIQIVSNIYDFLELKKDFLNFFNTLYISGSDVKICIQLNKQEDILRTLHTFKGLFYQMQMFYTPDAIHNLESIIAQMISDNKSEKSLEEKENIKKAFTNDLQILEDTLGVGYFNTQEKIEQNNKLLKKFKYKLKGLIKKPVNINYKIQSLISQIDLLAYIDIHDYFVKHIDLVDHLALLLDKPMHPLIIDGDKHLKVPPNFKVFIRNLVHVYKNSVDHGIEDVDTRLTLEKDEKGQIQCKYYYADKHLHVIIKDDGAGIDVDRLVSKAIEANIITKEQSLVMSESDKLHLIFTDNLSTKNSANEISGRGVGLAALKSSCEELNGTVSIVNDPNKGLEYYFKIPMSKILNNFEIDEDYEEKISIVEAVANRIKIFFKEDLSIDIIDARFVNDTPLLNKINSMVDIKSSSHIQTTLSFSFTNEIVRRFTEVYFKDLLEDKDEYEQNIDEVSKEIVNTLVGLSMQDFPAKFTDGILSLPQTVDVDSMNQISCEDDCKVISMIIQTNHGNMIFKLLQK